MGKQGGRREIKEIQRVRKGEGINMTKGKKENKENVRQEKGCRD